MGGGQPGEQLAFVITLFYILVHACLHLMLQCGKSQKSFSGVFSSICHVVLRSAFLSGA